MTKRQALARAIASLRRDVQRDAATANLERYGATSTEVVSASKERKLNLIAIEMLRQEYERARRKD